MKRSSVILVVAALLLLTSPVLAKASSRSEAPFAQKLLDVALVRPVTLVGSLTSTALCVGLSPLTWLLGPGVGVPSVDYLVVVPWRFTAGRYAGDFRNYIDGRTATGELP